MDVEDYTVGAVAGLTSVSVRTLHHYDDAGLLQPSGRNAAGYAVPLRHGDRRLDVVYARIAADSKAPHVRPRQAPRNTRPPAPHMALRAILTAKIISKMPLQLAGLSPRELQGDLPNDLPDAGRPRHTAIRNWNKSLQSWRMHKITRR